MFKCQKCSQSTYRPIRIVTERKMVHHIPEDKAHGPHGGYGSQIVSEINVCDTCLPSTPEMAKPERIVFEKKPVSKVDFDNNYEGEDYSNGYNA